MFAMIVSTGKQGATDRLGAPRRSMPLRAFLGMLTLCCALALAGCGTQTADSIRVSLTQQMNELKTDGEDFTTTMEGTAADSFKQLSIDPKEFSKAYLDGFDYKIESIDVDEGKGTATAKVTLTVKSMNDILNAFTADYAAWMQQQDTVPSEDEQMKEGGKLMLAAAQKAQTKQVDVDLPYEKGSDGTWKESGDLKANLIAALMG